MKQAYLKGVKLCEAMYQSGCTFDELGYYIGVEAEIGGYKWEDWGEGFRDCIKHLERLEMIAEEEGNG